MKAAYPHCADRLFGRPHAIEPNAFRTLIEGPAGRRILSGERPEISDGGAQNIRTKRLAMIEADPVSVANGCGEYALTSEGIAIVPVMGVLSQRFDWLAAICGWTTYEGLAATFDAMLSDYRVRAILMDVESPGGEAAGMLDAADLILAAREKKPIWAVANTFAASAAYAIAASASQLFVPRLGIVGSIGAVCIHVDQSAQDAAFGERYTAVYSGARKIDGWEHAPLSDAAQASMQRGVDHCRDEFAALVARQGRMSQAAAIATEAAIYHDAEAVAAGLADQVGSFDAALAALTAEVNGNSPRAAMAAQSHGAKHMAKAKSGIVDQLAERAKDGTSVAALATAAAAPASAMAAAQPQAGSYDENTDDETSDEIVGDPNGDPRKAPDDNEDDDDDGDQMKKPGPGETCGLCGQIMPMSEDGNVDNSAHHHAHGHDAAGLSQAADLAARITEIGAILDLCTVQNMPMATARGFIKSGITLDAVRGKIAASKAAGADRAGILAINPGSEGQSGAEIQASWAEAHKRVRESLKSATGA